MMIVYTDSTEFADRFLSGAGWRALVPSDAEPDIQLLLSETFGERPVFEADVKSGHGWRYLLAAETSSRSQYDMLVGLRRAGHTVPDRLLSLSGAGTGLHGLKNRPWAAEAGNIHLSVFLNPQGVGPASGTPFMVLAALSAVEAIDEVPGIDSRVGVKWVNDILIADAKVGGVLAYTEGAGRAVETAVLGIGLNVETTPTVAGTPFVPKAGAIGDFVPSDSVCTQGTVFQSLVGALDRNYQLLLEGSHDVLIDRYRARSLVVGKMVKICVDDSSMPPKTIVEGMVEAIGDNLELVISGSDKPVSLGRLILEPKGQTVDGLSI